MRTRTIVGIAMGIGIMGATAPASSQGPSPEIWLIHCLSAGEQQRISAQFVEALKPYGLNEPEKLGQRIQVMLGEAIEMRSKADQCTEAAGDAAPQRCKAQEAAAAAAEKRMEKFGEDMEKLEKDLLAIRTKYRKC